MKTLFVLALVLAVAPAADTIRPRGGDGPAPLSPAQQRIWFLQQMEPESTVFSIAQSIMREDVNGRQLHQRREAHGGTHVVDEDALA